LSKRNIKSEFQVTGIWLFNPKAIDEREGKKLNRLFLLPEE
jgi:hypothetical protein